MRAAPRAHVPRLCFCAGRTWAGNRFLVATGYCDYTGWDCQAANNLCVAKTLDDAIQFGLNESERVRLGLSPGLNDREVPA